MNKLSLLTLMYLLLINGCSTSPNSQFYLLNPIDPDPTNTVTAGLADKFLGIGPIGFPKYLDRPHIVTRSGNAEIYLSDIHRWAEPLQDNFTRVLAENLSRQLGTEKIFIVPSRNRGITDYRVTMEVLQFDAGRNGEVMLIAYWNLFAGDSITPAATNRSEFRLNASRNADYTELVDTLSLAVARLSREIAKAVSDLSASDPPPVTLRHD